MIITTSWDDGHKSDLRLTKLLNQYGLKGTFYISKAGDFRSLTDDNIKEIFKTQEIGAHTLTHPDLTEIDLAKVEKEIIGSKEYLESLLKKKIKMFCYPEGEYNQKVKEITIKSGFLGARTIKEFNFEKPNDFFEMETTIHIYPFPFRKRNANHYHLTRFLFQPLQRKFAKVLKIGLPFNSFFNWLNLAKNLFDYTKEEDGVFHLWGHSWELDRYDMWNDLEGLFRYIRQRENIISLTNSEVLEKK